MSEEYNRYSLLILDRREMRWNSVVLEGKRSDEIFSTALRKDKEPDLAPSHMAWVYVYRKPRKYEWHNVPNVGICVINKKDRHWVLQVYFNE